MRRIPLRFKRRGPQSACCCPDEWTFEYHTDFLRAIQLSYIRIIARRRTRSVPLAEFSSGGSSAQKKLRSDFLARQLCLLKSRPELSVGELPLT